jgi:hypothetical protein
MGKVLLKSGFKMHVSIGIISKRSDRRLTSILHKNTARFIGYENGLEIINHTGFYLTIDILNTNKDKINNIDLLRPYEKIIKRNEVLDCLEEYITDKGKPLMFRDEKSRCLGDRVFGASYKLEVGYSRVSCNIQTVVVDGGRTRTRTEPHGGRTRTEPYCGSIVGNIFDSIVNTSSRALLRAGRALEQVRFRETITNEEFYENIKYDFGMFSALYKKS